MGPGIGPLEGLAVTQPSEPGTRKLISVVIPAYNESACVDESARRLQALMKVEVAYDFEVIIVENGSADDTWEKLNRIHVSDPRFKILQLARDFRMDGGLTAGLANASGDAAVVMTADLQDPPELISAFLRKWEEGYENIYMVVSERRGTGSLRTFNSKAFYWLAGKLTDGAIPRNASDFRLVDRGVYETINQMQERNRFVRGLFAWVGYKSIGIPHVRPHFDQKLPLTTAMITRSWASYLSARPRPELPGQVRRASLRLFWECVDNSQCSKHGLH